MIIRILGILYVNKLKVKRLKVYKENYYNYKMLFGNSFNEFDLGFCILKLIRVFIKL